MYYLLKTEPSEYSFADLQQDGSTVWDGISNPQALKYLREMQKADQLIIYHTGDERRTAGTATVMSAEASDPKSPKVKIKAGKPLARSRTLAELKSVALFKDSPLLKQSRLSVVPLTEQQWKLLTK